MIPEGYFALTVDTEADDGWRRAHENTLKNVYQLAEHHQWLVDIGARPTYLVSYECVNDNLACSALEWILKQGNAEIGSHLHVWSAPPFIGPSPNGVDLDAIGGIQSDLSDELLAAKSQSLHEKIKKCLGVSCRSHRAGRWGGSNATLRWLESAGYLCDLSARDETVLSGPGASCCPRLPYWPSLMDWRREALSREERSTVLEIPISVFPERPGIGSWLHHRGVPGARELRRIIRALGLGRPGEAFARASESLPLSALRQRVGALSSEDHKLLTISLHSSELIVGGSPYTDTPRKLEELRRRVEVLVKTALNCRRAPITASEVYQIWSEQEKS